MMLAAMYKDHEGEKQAVKTPVRRATPSPAPTALHLLRPMAEAAPTVRLHNEIPTAQPAPAPAPAPTPAPAAPAAPPPVTFAVSSFTTSGSGNAILTPTATNLKIDSPVFRSSANVTATGAAAEVTNWDVGYIQTVFAHNLEAEYLQSFERWQYPTIPVRDGVSDGVVPWYNTFSPIATSGTAVSVNMSDHPNHTVTWTDPRTGRVNSLMRYRRSFTFGAWLIARRRATGTVNYLKYVNWNFSFVVDVDSTQPFASRATNSGTGMPAPTSGSGQGAQTPVLTGAVANNTIARTLVAKPPPPAPAPAP
jgi:hypothetical protein